MLSFELNHTHVNDCLCFWQIQQMYDEFESLQINVAQAVQMGQREQVNELMDCCDLSSKIWKYIQHYLSLWLVMYTCGFYQYLFGPCFNWDLPTSKLYSHMIWYYKHDRINFQAFGLDKQRTFKLFDFIKTPVQAFHCMHLVIESCFYVISKYSKPRREAEAKVMQSLSVSKQSSKNIESQPIALPVPPTPPAENVECKTQALTEPQQQPSNPSNVESQSGARTKATEKQKQKQTLKWKSRVNQSPSVSQQSAKSASKSSHALTVTPAVLSSEMRPTKKRKLNNQASTNTAHDTLMEE